MQSIPIFIPKNTPIDSAVIESYMSRLKDDTEGAKSDFGNRIGYIGNGAVFGVALSYEDGILTVGNGCVSIDGYSNPITSVDIVTELNAGDYVVFDDYTISKSSEPEGIILGKYDGSGFDYSVRSMNSPEELSTVEVVNNIDAASNSVADYIYVWSSGELYIKDDRISDEMLSVVDRTEDMVVTPTKIGTNITSAKLKMSPGITAITKIESNSIINCEGAFRISVMIDGNEVDTRTGYVQDQNASVYIESECFIKKDATIAVRLYSDHPATVVHSELYVG